MTGAPPAIRKSWWRRFWFSTWKMVRGVIMLEDTPHRIALGSACGIFASVLPILGQTFVGMALAKIGRANVFAAIPWSWLTNPATTLPVFYLGYLIGAAVLPGYEILSMATIEAKWDAAQHAGGWWDAMTGVLAGILVPMWTGAILLGLALGLPGYYLVRRAVTALQARRERRRQSWKSAATVG